MVNEKDMCIACEESKKDFGQSPNPKLCIPCYEETEYMAEQFIKHELKYL